MILLALNFDPHWLSKEKKDNKWVVKITFGMTSSIGGLLSFLLTPLRMKNPLRAQI
jgi:hypothetical protein